MTGPATDLHSGLYGGTVHNANQALAELLATLHGADGRVNVPGFYDDVRPLSAAEQAEMAKIPYRDEELRRETGVAAPTASRSTTWSSASARGPPWRSTACGAASPAKAARPSSPARPTPRSPAAWCRTRTRRIGAAVTAALQERAPKTISVEVTPRHGGVAFVAPLDTPAIQAAARAYAAVFGVEPLYMRSGGGIPIVTILHDVLDAPVVLMGFGLPDDNLHAPNEKFLLANFYRGIATSAAFLHELTA
ncbi:MAG: M20/M25/M40 family metallo-hydrolase [Caldilineaceae bacterium]